MTGHDIVLAARSQLDTPFMHQGRLPGMALDCAGLIVVVAKLLNIPIDDQAGYSRTPAHGLLEAAIHKQPAIQFVRLSEIAAGDILLMRFSGEPQHLAIFTGETIIHAYERVGKVAEHRLDMAWRRRIVSAHRFIQVVE